MTFSIIIPSYNQELYLPDAIESALEQTVPTEIIVIDDGSTDHSLEIARKYPVKVISQVNKGLASARNTGIMNATGEYILPLDADDILLPNCVETLQGAAESTKADVIAPSFKTFGVYNGEVILSGLPTMDEMKQANRLPYFCAIKKSVLQEVGGYSPRMTHGYEDYHLWFDLFKRGKQLCAVNQVLVLYRTKQESMLTRAQRHHGELMDQIVFDHKAIW